MFTGVQRYKKFSNFLFLREFRYEKAPLDYLKTSSRGKVCVFEYFLKEIDNYLFIWFLPNN